MYARGGCSTCLGASPTLFALANGGFSDGGRQFFILGSLEHYASFKGGGVEFSTFSGFGGGDAKWGGRVGVSAPEGVDPVGHCSVIVSVCGIKWGIWACTI